MLNGAVHFGNGQRNFGNALALFFTRNAYFPHQLTYLTYITDQLSQTFARIVNLLTSATYMRNGFINQRFYFLRGSGAALGQRAYFGGHNGKPSPGITCSGGFNRGIQGENIGLERNAVDNRDNFHHSAG